MNPQLNTQTFLANENHTGFEIAEGNVSDLHRHSNELPRSLQRCIRVRISVLIFEA